MAMYQQGPRLVEAVQVTDDERIVHTADGYKVSHQGDWIITDAAQRQEIIADSFFRASFQQVPDAPVEEAPVVEEAQPLPVVHVAEEETALQEPIVEPVAEEETQSKIMTEAESVGPGL